MVTTVYTLLSGPLTATAKAADTGSISLSGDVNAALQGVAEAVARLGIEIMNAELDRL